MLNDPSWLRQLEALLLSALRNDGFRRFCDSHYGRIRGDVFQFLVLQLPGAPAAGFALEFGSMLLVEPHTFLNLDLGGDFPDPSRSKTYTVKGAEEVPAAAEAVIIDYVAVCRPGLERTSTLKGFTTATAKKATETATPHATFTLATAYARAGLLDKAEHLAQQARDAYIEHQSNPLNAWAARGVSRCSLLLTSLYAGTTVALQDGWRAGSIAALGLSDLDDAA